MKKEDVVEVSVILTLILGIMSVLFLIVSMAVEEEKIATFDKETITSQQYYSQSLQYLEDIRNSNDIIQANCTP